LANIFDVANKAGVSKSTVSRVITNSPGVNQETKDKILRAIEELGYQPSRAAQTLRNKKTNLIAVIIPRISNPYYSKLMQAIEQESSKYNYQVVLCNTENDPLKELQYLKMLENNYVDGVILTAFRGSMNTLRDYQKFGPIIFVGESKNQQNFPTVKTNNMEASYSATEHLINLGHRHIGIVTGPEYSSISYERLKGFQKAMEDNGIEINEDWVSFSSYGIQQGKTYFENLKKAHSVPSAVFATNDELAVGIIQQARAMGMSVPEDLAVIGFDNQQIATVIHPSLTTVDQPIVKMGAQAFKLLNNSLLGEELSYSDIILDSKLLVRESCGAGLK
jgi:LacI family transcriptional regulator, repressor for deo operon, udp, cdd, tsx, nupC, and nupG